MSIIEYLIATGISDLQATRYASLAATTIIVYDHMITFEQEIDLIWQARWSIVKYIFFLNRYYILSAAIFNTFALFGTPPSDAVRLCWFRWQGWTGLSACMIAEVILQTRLYALYLMNKKVLAFMVVCFLISSACAAAVMGQVLSKITAISELVPGKRFCIPLHIEHHFYVFWIPIIVFETILCGLALNRGIQTVRAERGGTFHFRRDLVNVLVRDSVLYFLIILVTYLTNLVVWFTQPEYLTEIPIAFSVAMSCVMGNRIILNVRGVTRELQSGDKPPLHLPAPASLVIVELKKPNILNEVEMWELRNMRAEAA